MARRLDESCVPYFSLQFCPTNAFPELLAGVCSAIVIGTAIYQFFRKSNVREQVIVRTLVILGALTLGLEVSLSRFNIAALPAFTQISTTIFFVTAYAFWVDTAVRNTFAACQLVDCSSYLIYAMRTIIALAITISFALMVGLSAAPLDKCQVWAKAVYASHTAVGFSLHGPLAGTYIILSSFLRGHLKSMKQSGLTVNGGTGIEEVQSSLKKIRRVAVFVGVLMIVVAVYLTNLGSNAQPRDGCNLGQAITRILTPLLALVLALWHTNAPRDPRIGSSRKSGTGSHTSGYLSSAKSSQTEGTKGERQTLGSSADASRKSVVEMEEYPEKSV